MLHYFFALILLVHSFIHVLGFAHELQFKLEDDGYNGKDLETNRREKLVSAVWLISYLLFLGAVILYLLFVHHWWIPAAVGVVLSQTLIFLDWNEAKYGTVTNIIIMLVIIPFLWQM
jgi:hypothetical protein